jgi:hypothetical protein
MNAAEVARRASEETARELGRVTVMIDVQKLSALCREVRASASGAARSTVSRPLHDLRVGLAELRATPGQALCPPETWDKMIASVKEVSRRVETAVGHVYSKKFAAEVRSVVSQVDEELHRMAPRATATPFGGT